MNQRLIITLLAICITLVQPLTAQVQDRLPESLKEMYTQRIEPLRMSNPSGRAIKIRDLVEVTGEESVKLTGFGVVTGLNKTGDKGKAAREMLLHVIKKQGLRVKLSDITGQNVALVSISASVSPHQRSFDVSVKSIGDARSLQNGFLEASTLSPIGSTKIFALAQGPLALGARHFETQGAEGADAGFASVTIGHPTVGLVLHGGELLKEIPSTRLHDNRITLFIKYPNNRTSTNIANVINDYMENIGIKAYPKSASSVVLHLPSGYEGYDGKLTRLIADIGDLSTQVSREAIITIDQGTGVIAMTEGVKMEPGSIAVGGLTVTVSSDITPVTRQGTFEGETRLVDVPELTVSEDRANFLSLPAGTDLRKVQETLNALKLKPTSIISVFSAMHKAGMIHADIRVLPR
ncbi:Flagellar P-ring protein [Chlamydiales bacterium SCGC AG-110-M15]|nr:Flagellar P-ring protein [Chlamydiales bacterium SCGC AG-110-M15]